MNCDKVFIGIGLNVNGKKELRKNRIVLISVRCIVVAWREVKVKSKVSQWFD